MGLRRAEARGVGFVKRKRADLGPVGVMRLQ